MYNQAYLQSLIENRIEENINLDYKAADALQRNDKKTKEISKDVSAFANSAGGIIVYGLREDNIDDHLPSQIDPIDRKTISKEWLEQIIQGNIQPRIDGIIVHPVEIDGDIDKVVYIVEILKSATAHQANDQKYYKRYNFNSIPMYDYEIRDIFNRIKHPLINLEFEIVETKSNQEYLYSLKVYAVNNGTVLANYINCYLTIPQRCLKSDYIPVTGSVKQYFGDNTVRDIVEMKGVPPNHSYVYGPSRYEPLLPRLRRQLDFNIPTLHEFYYEGINNVDWVIYTDNAEPVTGTINLTDLR